MDIFKVCLARIPYDGRNFEYISGEDPFLGMVMVQPAVEGIQSKGVIANAKHFVNNNQETNRTSQTAHVSLSLVLRAGWGRRVIRPTGVSRDLGRLSPTIQGPL